jgi:hypothetical protein
MMVRNEVNEIGSNKKFYFSLITIVFVVVLPLLLIEFGSLAVNRALESQFPSTYTGKDSPENRATRGVGVRDHVRADFYKWKVKFGYRYMPYGVYVADKFESKTLNIGADGFRITDYLKDTDFGGSQTFNIAVFGSSALFGYPVSADDETVTYYMEEALNSKKSASSLPIKVKNFSVPNYKVYNDIFLMNKAFSSYKIDMVIFLNGWNDLLAGLRGTTYDAPIAGDRMRELWQKHERMELVNWEFLPNYLKKKFPNTFILMERVNEYFSNRVVRSKFAASKENYLTESKELRRIQEVSTIYGIHSYLSFMESAIATSRSKKVKMIIGFQPSIFTTKKKLTRNENILLEWQRSTRFRPSDEEIRDLQPESSYEFIKYRSVGSWDVFVEGYNIAKTKIELLAEKNGIRAIDFDELTRDVEGPVFADHVHYSPFGSRVIANIFVKSIIEIEPRIFW